MERKLSEVQESLRKQLEKEMADKMKTLDAQYKKENNELKT